MSVNPPKRDSDMDEILASIRKLIGTDEPDQDDIDVQKINASDIADVSLSPSFPSEGAKIAEDTPASVASDVLDALISQEKHKQQGQIETVTLDAVDNDDINSRALVNKLFVDTIPMNVNAEERPILQDSVNLVDKSDEDDGDDESDEDHPLTRLQSALFNSIVETETMQTQAEEQASSSLLVDHEVALQSGGDAILEDDIIITTDHAPQHEAAQETQEMKTDKIEKALEIPQEVTVAEENKIILEEYGDGDADSELSSALEKNQNHLDISSGSEQKSELEQKLDINASPIKIKLEMTPPVTESIATSKIEPEAISEEASSLSPTPISSSNADTISAPLSEQETEIKTEGTASMNKAVHMLTTQAEVDVRESFRQLAALKIADGEAKTLEDLVSELMKPLLQDWLSENLPNIVERVVKEEVSRLAR